MKAIEVVDSRLEWKEVPDPVPPKADEILIAIHATAVNRADLSQRQGGYPPPPGASPILGLECAGEVLDIGDQVSQFRRGDSVCALLAGGGYAEQVVVPAGQVLPIPKGFSFEQAAAIPEVYATAFLNIFVEAVAKPGERVLIHAGASGVGTSAIHMCYAYGNPCWVTASGENKIQYCQSIGADGGTDRQTGDFVAEVHEWTGGQGVDVILDPVGGAYLERNLKALNTDGRLVVIGLMGGANADLPLGRMMVKRQRIIGSTLRARSIVAKTQVMQALHERVWPLFAVGMEPDIHEIIDISDADRAHQVIASNQTIGKVVLKVR